MHSRPKHTRTHTRAQAALAMMGVVAKLRAQFRVPALQARPHSPAAAAADLSVARRGAFGIGCDSATAKRR